MRGLNASGLAAVSLGDRPYPHPVGAIVGRPATDVMDVIGLVGVGMISLLALALFANGIVKLASRRD